MRKKREDRVPWIMFRSVLFLTLVLLPSGLLGAANPDELYAQGKFKEASAAYQKLDLDTPGDLKYRYNRGCAAFQAGSLDEAKAAFTSVMRRSTDEEMRFRALYNLGNTSFKQEDFSSAKEYYKEALKVRPDDGDARHNLELALKALKKQQDRKNGQNRKEGQGTDNPQKEDGSSQEKGKDDRGKEGNSKQNSDKQGQQDQQGKPGKDGDGKQDGKSGQRSDRNQGSRDGQHDAQGEEKQDLSGELKGKNIGSESGTVGKEMPEGDAALMEKKKAESLLNNINESRGRMNRFQGMRGGKSGVGSGKEW